MPKWYQFWKDEKETTKPEGGIFVSGVRRDYDSSVSQVTPESLAAILRGAASGSIRQQMDLFTLIEEDPHIKSVLNKRRLNVCSKKMAIAPYDEEKISQQACDICNEIVFGIGSMGGIGNLKEAIFNSTDAIGKGFAINQIVWQLLDGKWRIPKLAWWPQSECAVGNPSKLYDQDSDKIFILTDANRVTGEELQQYQWMAYVYKSASTPLARAGLLRSVAWFYLFKRFAFKDWAVFIEAYGMPRRVGKYNRASTREEKATILEATEAIGKDGAVIIPDDATIELLAASGGAGALPQPEMVERCNAEISKAILGGTLTTEAGDRGARSLGEVHQSNEANLMKADCEALAETFKRDVLTPIVRFNVGPNAPIPNCEFLIDESEDLRARAERDRILCKDLGLPIAKKYFYDKYDLPAPEAEDELLEVPAGAPIAAMSDGVMLEVEKARLELRVLAEKKKMLELSDKWGMLR